MLLSLAYIFLCGLLLGSIVKQLRLPPLLGMMLSGIILGPSLLNLLDDSLLSISADLRQLALIIILTRAGLTLNIDDLKKVGRPAFLLCFVPACIEMFAMILIAPRLLGVSLLEAAIMGAVVAAVSPAVIVPKMLYLMQHKYGTKKSIPQMIMAGASVDDVFVLVVFTSFISLAQGENLSVMSFIQIPTSIILGVGLGLLSGSLFVHFFKRFIINDAQKVIIILSISFLLIAVENMLKGKLAVSGLLAIMSMAAMVYKRDQPLANRLSLNFTKLWIPAEILLFSLVGASINFEYVSESGVAVIFVLIFSLFFRMIGVYICLIKTKLTQKERLFCMIAYSPKATVQAAIGSIPLSLGLACGNIVLTVAVFAILLSAPLGALLIDVTHKKLLNKT